MNSMKFTAPSWVPGIGGKSYSANIPNIPRLANGGLVSQPTLAMVGDNKNAQKNPEVVSPLDSLQAMIDNAVSSAMGKGGGGATEVILKVGETEFGRVAIKAINSVQRQTGTSLITV